MADEIRKCADLEERLTPYVDNEDTPSAHRAVEAHLSGCADCTGHARNEASARAVVREHREAMTAHAPESLRARCADSFQLPAPGVPRGAAISAIRRWAPLSLAATLVLAIAGVFVFGLNDRVEALAASLAVDHVKCFKVNGTGGHADPHLSEAAWQQDRGWAINVPPAEPGRALKLVDVRRCLSSDGWSAHMMYTWGGEPLSVYVIQGDGVRDRLVRKVGAQAVIWSANRRTYAVVSSDTSRDLTPIVDYMRTRVR
jgi:anti-sigma factor RsiW